MTNFKEYKSVTEFPLHLEKLSREEVESAYQDLRNTYKNLNYSRVQLVRRQTEAKTNIVAMQKNLTQLTVTLENVQKEKQQLQKSLVHSIDVQKQLDKWGNDLAGQVDNLTAQMSATTQLLGEFESAYEDVREEKGVLSLWQRLHRLLTAAQRLLNTDINTLKSKKIEPVSEEWAKETPSNIGRKLLDD